MANLDNIFMASGFRRGMRKIAKELVRSGGDTDLASLVDNQLGGHGHNNSSGNDGSSLQEIVQIGRSIGTAYRKEMLKNIGEIEDDEFGEDGVASGHSSKQMILGSESELPFGQHLDDSSMNQSPISMHMNAARMQRY